VWNPPVPEPSASSRGWPGRSGSWCRDGTAVRWFEASRRARPAASRRASVNASNPDARCRAATARERSVRLAPPSGTQHLRRRRAPRQLIGGKCALDPHRACKHGPLSWRPAYCLPAAATPTPPPEVRHGDFRPTGAVLVNTAALQRTYGADPFAFGACSSELRIALICSACLRGCTEMIKSSS